MNTVTLLVLLAIIAVASAVEIPTIARRWYVGGEFDSLKSTDGKQFMAKNFAYWDGAKWGTVGTTGTDGPVYTIKMDAKFNLMIGGRFTKVNGVATGAVARYSTALSKWESVVGTATFSPGSEVRALATDCFSLTLTTVTSTRCDVYFGGNFTLNAGGNVVAQNVARWFQKTNDEGVLENLGTHNIKGVVYALYKKAVPTLTSDSSKYLWVGGDLKTTGGAKYFGRFENVETASKVSFVNLDGNMNGPVYAFEYINTYVIGQTDTLYIAGAFNFTSTGGVVCNKVCTYNHKDKKFTKVEGVAKPNFATGVAYDIGLNGNDLVVGGSFQKPYQGVAVLKSGKTTWDIVHGTQATKVNFNVKTIDVCSKFSKSCTAGSVAAGSMAGDIQFFDNEKATWENFGGARNPLNKTVGSPSLHKIYSYAAAGSVKVTFAVLAVVSFVAMIFV